MVIGWFWGDFGGFWGYRGIYLTREMMCAVERRILGWFWWVLVGFRVLWGVGRVVLARSEDIVCWGGFGVVLGWFGLVLGSACFHFLKIDGLLKKLFFLSRFVALLKSVLHFFLRRLQKKKKSDILI